jgi:hypothetical protein
MKHTWILLASLMPAWGLTLYQRDNPAVVQMDIQRRDVVDPVTRDRRRKRSSTVTQPLDNEV